MNSPASPSVDRSGEPKIQIRSDHTRKAHLEHLRSRYVKSHAMLEQVLPSIPLGSQTFSKSHIQYPSQAGPLFLERGQGAHVWDLDGNEYIDFVNSLLCVILGYVHPEVDAAVITQLGKGISFSLPTTLEGQLAERLKALIPSAEMVRYGKNGSDATSAAVRLARAFTGRDRIAVCGYHGWQDWFIGSTARHKGVPDAVRDLTHAFGFNNLASLEKILNEHPNEFALVMLEPMNVAFPEPGFLEGVKELAHRHGALVVFDETITGFRFHIGGAQALFGVTPDLSTFGKGMANGFPLAAVVGRADVMGEMNDIFFSGTFGGEALSLAASLATIDILERENVPQMLEVTGEKVMRRFDQLVAKHGLEDQIKLVGHPSWSLLQFFDAPIAGAFTIKSLYLQELLAQGILCIGSHNMSFSHTETHLNHLAQAQDNALATVREALEYGDVRAYLVGPPMEPLFRVR
jgi:glutamate-1-semialdehyde 2,1-aminomutase